MRENLRYSQVNKTEEVQCPAGNAENSLAGWNERSFDCNLKLYEEIKKTVEVNTWAVIKASIIIAMVCNSTFYFLQNLREKHVILKK